MDTTEQSHFTSLELPMTTNEVAHIANMDAATMDATTGAEAVDVGVPPPLPIEVVQQGAESTVTGMDDTQQQQHHHHHHHSQLLHPSMPVEMDANEASEISNAILGTVDDVHQHTINPTEYEEQMVNPEEDVGEEGVAVDEEEDEDNASSWHDFFFQLQAHKATFGTMDVDPQTYPLLHNWIVDQRTLYKTWKDDDDDDKEAISQERVVLLDALGFDWEGNEEPNFGTQVEAAAANSNISGSTQDVESFHFRLSQLEQYKAVYGHPNVPETYKEDPVLGKWVGQQRALFRKQALPQDRMDALHEIGFDFTPGDKKFTFEMRLEQLKEYKDIHGDVNVPRRYAENPGYVYILRSNTVDCYNILHTLAPCPTLTKFIFILNHSLGEWLYIQKKNYRRNEGGSSAENRYELLSEVGVDFSEEKQTNNATSKKRKARKKDEEDAANRSEKWDEKFNELRAFKDTNGHTNVARRSKRNPAIDSLGEWVHFQRRQYRNLLKGENSTLTIARKKALELLGFQWYRNTGRSSASIHNDGDNSSLRMSISEAVQAQIIKAYEDGKSAPWEDRFAQLTEYVQVSNRLHV